MSYPNYVDPPIEAGSKMTASTIGYSVDCDVTLVYRLFGFWWTRVIDPTGAEYDICTNIPVEGGT